MAAGKDMVGIAIGGQYVELSPDELAEARKNLAAAEKSAERDASQREVDDLRRRLTAGRDDAVIEGAPAELWAIMFVRDPHPNLDRDGGGDYDDPSNPRLVAPVDGCGDPLMVFKTFEDAVDSAVHHKMVYDFDTRPVRIK